MPRRCPIQPTIQLCDPSQLAVMMRAGDLDALDRMTRCYADRLLAVGLRLCPSEADARDAVQDALLSAGEHLEDFRGDGRIEGWLKRMVANACYRRRRGRKNDPALHQRDTTEAIPSGGGSPEDDAFRGQVSRALGDALAELAPEDRTILVLAEGEGWSGPEIAERTGLSPGAVRVRLTRLRKRLRERLEPLREELLGDGV